MPTLTIQLPSQPPVFHVLKDETITIGRMKGNTIVIEDSSISLMHAKITRKDGQFYLKDLNSTNGTMVNGQPIGEARLRDQDKVRFAEITTQFLMEDIVPAGALVASAVAVSAGAPVAVAPPRPAATMPAAPVPNLAGPRPEASAPTTASTAERQITQKTTSTASTTAKKGKVSRRVSIVAAALVLVVLPGIGFVLWKTTGRETQKSAANAPQQPPKGPFSAAKAATALTPPKSLVEGRAVSSTTEAISPAGSNIGELVSALKSKDAAERRQAAASLHDLGMEAKEATPALKEALKDSDAEVQMWAALSLVNTQTYDKAVIPILVRSLKNDNAVLRQVACLSLGLFPYEAGDKVTVVPALTEAAGKDPSADVREAAKSALHIIGADAGSGTESESAVK